MSEEKSAPMTPEQSQRAFAVGKLVKSQAELPYPQGKARPACGWDPYLAHPDLLAELRVVKPSSENVLLRAITKSELRGGSEIYGAEDSGLDAVAFEVIAISDDVPKTWGLEVGMHCLHLSAAADGLSQHGDSMYFQVFYKDVSSFWSPAEVQAAMDAVDGCQTLDELRAFVAESCRRDDV